MKKTFELDYPDGAMVVARHLQQLLCRQWEMPVYVREVGVPPEPPDELYDLAVDIADYIPNDRVGGDFECKYCGGRWEFRLKQHRLDPKNHSASCIWRRAKEYGTKR